MLLLASLLREVPGVPARAVTEMMVGDLAWSPQLPDRTLDDVEAGDERSILRRFADDLVDASQPPTFVPAKSLVMAVITVITSVKQSTSFHAPV